ncbi:unnamed protein product [Rotaria sp. Silwood2]|nr:unnamed protein product [Rotaria sp. Silwood2]
MEACGTSMDKFYTTMHAMDKTQHLDLLLKRMINHIADALLFLKSQNVLHLNIKPSNILLNQNPIIFKLGDSGICGRLTDCNPIMNIAITYLAPENFRPYSEYSRYNIRSDMWALGLSALEIASNKCPLSKMTTWETIINIQTWTPELPSNLSTELQELIIWLLKTQPEDRPEKYEDILASHAIQSLPTEITKEEEEMVKIIIEHIPKIDDD